ncbi:replication initiation protein [Spirosoma endbachense]|uniref:RepB family plasmid replication initiator protein n=1 Tax=Spirosoma endbachense TaxID=2666025 RepID=A0A6P1W4C5_9BACT|nr:replication initiation protein [Spirosoma endbachense]QHW00312.1 RepB family plasmid replication initiator protein [Spirosoma endbachense]
MQQNPEDQLAPLFTKRPTNYQPNLFTESKQEFTELEKKIVVLVVNQIGHMTLKGELQEKANVVFSIPFSELTRDHHKQIADAAESLQSKRLIYRNDAKGKFDFITPFPRVRSEVIDGKRVIELTMFADVVPHFAELGQRYTKYDIDVMLSLSSVYAQRMFEIVSMYHNRGQREFSYSVDRLMMMLNCPSRYTFNDFKKNALEVAQRELQQKANLYLEWSAAKKVGKKIIELAFIVKTPQQLAAEAVSQDQRTVNNMSINEAYTTAWQLMKNYKLKGFQKDRILSDHSLLDTFFRIDSELANGVRQNVKNPTAYLVKSLGIDQLKDPKPKTKPESKTVQSTLSLFPEGPTLRTGSVKSIGAIFGDMIMNE